MKSFEKLMNTNKGRLAWLLLLILLIFYPSPDEYDWIYAIVAIFLSWLAVNHLANKLELKHKKLWQIMTIPFGIGPITYLIFLIAKRKQLKLKESVKNRHHSTKKILLIIIIAFICILAIGFVYWFAGAILGMRCYMSHGMGVETMLPTLQKDVRWRRCPYKNIYYRLNLPDKYELKHGDIISFHNETTDNFLKMQNLSVGNYVARAIVLPDDTIQFKGGIVFLNGKPLDEQYTLSPNSTYAYKYEFKGKIYGNFLPECKVLKIPSNKVFALVDNREHGDDSRYFGLIDFDDIDTYLPFSIQKEGYTEGSNFIKYESNWRESNTTLTESALEKASEACGQ